MGEVSMVSGRNEEHSAEVQCCAEDDVSQADAGKKSEKRNAVHQDKRNRSDPIHAFIGIAHKSGRHCCILAWLGKFLVLIEF